MGLIKLKNGSEEEKALVVVVMVSLQGLLDKNPILFYELVMKCRDSKHELFGDSGKDLQDLALLQQDGNVHSSVRNIVLSAAQGEDLDLTLISPAAQ